MYFLAKNIRTCSSSLRGTQSTLLYKNGVLDWEYLAKNASYFVMHPEQLKQKLKEKDAHMLCQFFDSDEYKKRVRSFLEMQSQILSRDSFSGPKRVKYQHVLSCAQPSHKKMKNFKPKQEIKINESKPKKPKKGTIIDQLLKQRSHMEGPVDVDNAAIRSDGLRKKMRHKTTIMPVFLKKMKRKHIKGDGMEEDFLKSGYYSPTARNVPAPVGEPEPLYAQILHRSNINIRGPRSQAHIKENEAPTLFKSDTNTLIFGGHIHHDQEFDKYFDSQISNSNKQQKHLNDNESVAEEAPTLTAKRNVSRQQESNDENAEESTHIARGGSYKLVPFNQYGSANDPHTLTFEGHNYKKPLQESQNKEDYIEKNPQIHNRLDKDDNVTLRDKYKKYPPQNSYKAYPKIENNTPKKENFTSNLEKFKGDPMPSANAAYKLSNLSSKLDHVPYKLSKINSKYADVSLKLGSPSKSNIGHIPLRMSSSTARVIQRVTTKLCPKKNINVKRKSFSELLCMEPTKLRTSKSIKTKKAQSEPESKVKIEIVKNSPVKKKGGKDKGGEETKGKHAPLQMLMENVHKNRTLDLDDNLERKNTLLAILRNVGAKVENKTRLEFPSLFRKVKMATCIFKGFSRVNLFIMSKRKAEWSFDEPSRSESSSIGNFEDSLYGDSSDNNSEDESSLSEEDNDDGDNVQRSSEPIDVPWTENGIPRPPFPYTDTDGPQVQINIQDPVEILELFFDENLIDLIVNETNRYLLRLPKTTTEGYRVLMYAVRDPDPTKMNFNDVVKGFCMYNDCILSEDGLQEGYIVIFDMKDVGIGHLARVSLPALKCFMYYIQDAHPCRLKQIHVLNTASWIHHVMRLVVPLVRSELLNLVRFHKGNTPDNFPVELLPMDYGGEAPLVQDLDTSTKSLLDKYRHWLVETSEFKADESKRIKKASWWGLFSAKSPQQNDLDEKNILKNLQID